MKKQILKWSAISFVIASLSINVHAQNIGVNSTGAAPHASAALDVSSPNKGFLAPRVALTGATDVTTISSPAVSLLVYNTSTAGVTPNNVTPGYYYWDGTKWQAFLSSSQGGYIVGEVRPMFLTSDFGGWIILDGRSIASLTPVQQVRAISLGFTANIPNATDSYLTQTSGGMGAVTGTNTVTLSQANLPNVNFTGTTSSNGSHNHNYFNQSQLSGFQSPGTIPVADNNPINHQTDSQGEHTHTVTVNSGGSGTPVNIKPKSLNVKMFVYLGQ